VLLADGGEVDVRTAAHGDTHGAFTPPAPSASHPQCPCWTTTTGVAFDLASKRARKAPPPVMPMPYEFGCGFLALLTLTQRTVVAALPPNDWFATAHVIAVPFTRNADPTLASYSFPGADLLACFPKGPPPSFFTTVTLPPLVTRPSATSPFTASATVYDFGTG